MGSSGAFERGKEVIEQIGFFKIMEARTTTSVR
jgi:hypothetical protein